MGWDERLWAVHLLQWVFVFMVRSSSRSAFSMLTLLLATVLAFLLRGARHWASRPRHEGIWMCRHKAFLFVCVVLDALVLIAWIFLGYQLGEDTFLIGSPSHDTESIHSNPDRLVLDDDSRLHTSQFVDLMFFWFTWLWCLVAILRIHFYILQQWLGRDSTLPEDIMWPSDQDEIELPTREDAHDDGSHGLPPATTTDH